MVSSLLLLFCDHLGGLSDILGVDQLGYIHPWTNVGQEDREEDQAMSCSYQNNAKVHPRK